MDGFDNNENIETVENVETIDNGSQTTYSYDSAPAEGGSKVFGIISLVCGILGLICCCTGWFSIVLGVAAVVLGILSINKQEDAKGMAIAGIVCGGLGLLLAIIVLISVGALSSVDPDSIQNYVEQLEETL